MRIIEELKDPPPFARNYPAVALFPPLSLSLLCFRFKTRRHAGLGIDIVNFHLDYPFSLHARLAGLQGGLNRRLQRRPGESERERESLAISLSALRKRNFLGFFRDVHVILRRGGCEGFSKGCDYTRWDEWIDNKIVGGGGETILSLFPFPRKRACNAAQFRITGSLSQLER